MSGSDVFAFQRSGLNEFVFAAIGVEANGTTLSVASLFARMGRDPWTEAGLLARAPPREAIGSLARIFVEMPASAFSLGTATILAERLIALLPTRPRAATRQATVGSAHSSRRIGLAILLAGLFLAMTYGLLASREVRQPAGGDAFTEGVGNPPAPLGPAHRFGDR